MSFTKNMSYCPSEYTDLQRKRERIKCIVLGNAAVVRGTGMVKRQVVCVSKMRDKWGETREM